MTREEAISNLKMILEEVTETDEAVCYVTSNDAEALILAIKALERQTHNCKDCRHADYTKRENVIYCLEHGCMMSCDNCCRDWSENDD